VGRASWKTSADATNFGSAADEDYAAVNTELIVQEALDIGSLQAGPGGKNGFEVMMGGSNWLTATTPSAMIAWTDLTRTRAAASVEVYKTTWLTSSTKAYYDTYRDSLVVPRYKTTPDAFVPYKNLSTYVTPTSTGFNYDFRNIGHATDPIDQMRLYYSLDGIQFVLHSSNALNGSVTGLPSGQLIFLQWEFHNSYGWGPRSWNYPYASSGSRTATDLDLRCVVTTLGTPSGTPTCLTSPALMQRKYPSNTAPIYVAVDNPIDLTKTSEIYLGAGIWQGNLSGGALKEHLRGAAVSATGDMAQLTQLDINTTHGGRVTYGGVQALAGTTNIPDRPALAANIVFEGYANDAGFRVYNGEAFDSAVANSYETKSGVNHAVEVRQDATLAKIVTVGDDNVIICQGQMYPVKLDGQRARLIMNLTARKLLVVGHSYHYLFHVGIGTVGSDPNAPTFLYLGRDPNTTHYRNDVSGVSQAGFPKVVTIEGDFTVPGGTTDLELWLTLFVSTATGGSGGGEAAFLDGKITDTSI
jgi:hypothetical protein